MSHQTGISADESLISFLGQSKDAHRMIKISISEEKLVLANQEAPCGSWEEDYDPLVLSQLEEKQPCYVMYRLDSKNEMGFEWVMLSYSPDWSPTREKMLYAATRATMKKTFGGGQVKEELFGTVPDDVSLSGYKAHLNSQSAPAPLTFAEEELKLIKETESNHHIHVSSKHQTVPGISFPISDDAIDKLGQLQKHACNYIQLSIDLNNETIELASYDDTDANSLSSRFPKDHARYHLFLYKHTHEGDYMESIVFLYSMPGYQCSIKERMLYSSCKSSLIDVLEQHLGMEIARKLEVEADETVDEPYLYSEVHPTKNVARKAFAKPKGPAKRGPRRITKPAEQEES